MQRSRTSLTVSALTLALAAGSIAVAQQQRTQPADRGSDRTMQQDRQQDRQQGVVPGGRTVDRQQTGAHWRVSELLGSAAYDRAGSEIGDVEDLIIDLKNHKVALGVVSSGGVFGIGGQNYLVSWRSAQAHPDEGVIIDVDAAQLRPVDAYRPHEVQGDYEQFVRNIDPQMDDDRRMDQNMRPGQQQRDMTRPGASPDQQGVDRDRTREMGDRNDNRAAPDRDEMQRNRQPGATGQDRDASDPYRETRRAANDQQRTGDMDRQTQGGDQQSLARLGQMIDQAEEFDVEGRIMDVSRTQAFGFLPDGADLVIQSDDGQTRRVHVAPMSALTAKGFEPVVGQRISVSAVTVDPSRVGSMQTGERGAQGTMVLLAKEIDPENGEDITLWDDGRPAWTTTGMRDGNMRDRMTRDQDRTRMPTDGAYAANLRFITAENFIGSDINGIDEEDIGEVEDIVIDQQTGEIRYVVMSFGGFLGIGQKLFALPPSALTPRAEDPGDTDDDDIEFFVSITEQQLENAQGFDRDNWPDFGNQRWRETNDRSFGFDANRDRDLNDPAQRQQRDMNDRPGTTSPRTDRPRN